MSTPITELKVNPKLYENMPQVYFIFTAAVCTTNVTIATSNDGGTKIIIDKIVISYVV